MNAAKLLTDTREPIDVDGDGEAELTVWGGFALPRGARLASAPADILATFKGQPDASDVSRGRGGVQALLHCLNDNGGGGGGSKVDGAHGVPPVHSEHDWTVTAVDGAAATVIKDIASTNIAIADLAVQL